MGYALSTEELSQKFGDIYLGIVSYGRNTRASCIRRSSDDAVVAYSTIIFHDEGVAAGQEFHGQILSGKALGETIRNSGIPHDRIVSGPFSAKVNFGLSFLFGTKKRVCVSRTVEYKIKGFPYASITEFYNPEFIPSEEEESGPNDDLLINAKDWFLVDQLKKGFEEEYLSLAHGFLKKPIHVGIADRVVFIKETLRTLELLMQDKNTRLFVAANSKQFIGYGAINIHPALHVNGLECVIRELYVDEGFQGKGIGTVLADYIERYAKQRGCKRISLATNWDDEKQRTFYESIGFSRRCDFVTKKL